MKMKLCCAVAILAWGCCAEVTRAAVTFVGEYYDTGTWDESIWTVAETGNGPNSKLWEYENMQFPNVWNTQTPQDSNRLPAFFTNKFIADRYFNQIELKYSEGFMQDTTVGVKVYTDISTDNTNWTRIWELENSPSISWITEFGALEPADPNWNWVPDTWRTYAIPATKTLYVKHGVNYCYQALWQFMPRADSGVILDRTDAPPTTCEEVIAMGFPISGDVNNDCKVDFKDIAVIATNWLKCIVPGESGCNSPWGL
jgi:hypothetical protein